ncbi:hypothetical protein [Allorhizocola rhizosphaerae]|uniref:hypothetical protein n=1 Tax=Allorhizocola rhizosphaerae TaxID=1872709 RepID=UPI0013C2A90A|nr:hypothetical protein [Allorhizocola rhizosphaerae]
MTLEEAVIWQGMASDAAYAGHLSTDIHAVAGGGASILSLCVSPYLSLYVHESLAKLNAIDPTMSALLSSGVQRIVARSRHSLKLFEDNKRGVDGQLAYFRDVLMSAHRRRFLGNVRFRMLRFLETDLSLYRYNRRLISTTHAANFHMGQEPQDIFAMSGADIQAIYQEYGHFIAMLGGQHGTPGQTFVSHLDARKFDSHGQDVRSERYYAKVFDGPSNPDLNALLTVFQAMLNFAHIASTGICSAIDYSAFKMRFLTLYQVLSSLRILRNDELRPLTSRSTQFINKLVESREAQLILAPAAKPFRNTLMHYNLHHKVDKSRVDIRAPLFGLVPIYFPAHDSETFATAIDECIAKASTTMDEWARPL